MPSQKRAKKVEKISVIIPTFKQERTIQKDLLHIKSVLDQLRHDYEMVVVVDGMADRTFERAKKLASTKTKVFGYERNHGKGFAIRYGMAHSTGDIVGFIDSGMELNPNGLSMLVEHFEWYNADIIVGSKRHPVSKVNYPWDRKIISYLSQLFIRFLFGLNIRDTQVGMKFFRREVVESILPRLRVKKFAFDIEVLVVAHFLGYTRIFEAPIELNFRFKDSVISQNLMRILAKTLWDTLAIFYRLKIRRYYSDANKRKWYELEFKTNLG